MNDQELGALKIPAGAAEAEALGRLLLPCAEVGQLAGFVAPVPDTFFPSLHRKVGASKDHRDTVNRFCRTNPIDWCVEQFASGQCVRSVEWWRRRVDHTVAAVTCGCDPVTCPTCTAPGGASVSPCRVCKFTTGWEYAHLAELQSLQEVLNAA